MAERVTQGIINEISDDKSQRLNLNKVPSETMMFNAATIVQLFLEDLEYFDHRGK